MEVEKFDDLSLYQFASEVIRVGNRPVRKAREENHWLGLPNVFTINGKIYYELPNGEITTESPLKD
ncbi:MAG: hypothetical protein ICV83_07440 [Cytophagales bacterium]|nr:hypothetical protein [Cytophagales bacterium]